MPPVPTDVIIRAEAFRERLLTSDYSPSERKDLVNSHLSADPYLLDGLYAMPSSLMEMPCHFKELIFTSLLQYKRLDLLEGFLDKMVEDASEIGDVIRGDVLLDPAARTIVLDYIKHRYDHTRSPAEILDVPITILLLGNAMFSKDVQPYFAAFFDIFKPNPKIPIHFLNNLSSYISNVVINSGDHQTQVGGQLLDLLFSVGFDSETELDVPYGMRVPDATPVDYKISGLLHLAVHNVETAQIRNPDRDFSPHKMVQALLDRGANWRRLIDAPNVSAFQREVLLRQPHVRKALLEDITHPKQYNTPSPVPKF